MRIASASANVSRLAQCDRPIQERMVGHFTACGADFGRRVAEGIGLAVSHESEPARV
ncbi:MAG: catalase-related domain-containing protein [Candidatus Limnocylindrales bacterium]